MDTQIIKITDTNLDKLIENVNAFLSGEGNYIWEIKNIFYAPCNRVGVIEEFHAILTKKHIEPWIP